MWNRVFAVFRAGFEAQWGRGAWPVAPLVVHGSIAATFAALVGDVLPPYAYATFMLSLALALIALPLLGDFGYLLRADSAAEWIEAQPVSAFELRLARTGLVLVLVLGLSTAVALPIALLAPGSTSALGRVSLFLAAILQAVFVAGMLLGLQSLCGRRVEALLVTLQTLLVGGVLVGCLLGLQLVPRLVGVHAPADLAAGAVWLPSAWFAASVLDADTIPIAWSVAPWLAFGTAAVVLSFAPQGAPSAGRRRGFLAVILAPVRALVARTWVRREERGAFDLVFDALPLEREFVLRTYPLVAVPLAMLFAGSGSQSPTMRDGLVSLLLFTPAIYLPVLLVHVPATASAEARWILDGAPVPRGTIENGALKALVVRFLVPLYAVLSALAWVRSGPGFALTIAPLGFLVTLAVTRGLYGLCVSDLPLSVEPGAVKADMNWMGHILTIGMALAVVAIVALKFADHVAWLAGACMVLVLLEWNTDRKAVSRT